MGFYNYPIAHSYITRSYIGEEVVSGGIKQVLADPEAKKSIDDISASASQKAATAALDVFKGQLSGGVNAIKPYLPYIGIGIVGIVLVMWLL